MKAKLLSNKGESLVEVLVSIVIITLTIAFLFTSILTAKKINQAIKENNVNNFSYASVGTDGEKVSVTVQNSTEKRAIISDSSQAILHDNNGYVYYYYNYVKS